MKRSGMSVGARAGLLVGIAGGCGSVAAQGECSSTLGFTEVAASIGLDFQHAGPTSYGPGAEMSSGGVAGDFNNDGWQDLFVLASGSRPDALFINNGDGTFTDQAAAWGVDRSHWGIGAAAADYDGDGDLDIYVTSHSIDNGMANTSGNNRLYRNNGNGTFTDVAAAAGVNTTGTGRADGWGASFGDYDLDGDLDLAVAGWFENNDGNTLFRNNGDGTFTDVTAAAGLDALLDVPGNDPPNGFSPRFADMDGDRYPELIWTSDFLTSLYFINDGDGTFTEATAAAGVGLEENGMGVTVADFNNDGLTDWYATSIDYAYDQDPHPGGTGNMMYINQGNHTYAEVSDAVGVTSGWWGWGTAAVDFDHDGDLDLAETNGWNWTQYTGNPACLWLQESDGTFSELSQSIGFIHNESGRGLINFDYDNDGDQDVAIFTQGGRLYVFRNDLSGTCTGWLRVELGTGLAPWLAPHGIGAKIVVTANGQTQYREIHAGTNFISQSELTAHFGLSDAAVIDTLRVDWSDGTSVTRTNVAVDQSILIEACPADVNGDAAVDAGDFFAWVAVFGTGGPGCDQNGDGMCDAGDFFAWVAAFGVGC